MIEPIDHIPTRGLRRQRGAAMVEFVGIMFVVSMMMAGVIGRAGNAAPVPQITWYGVCKAYSTVPGVQIDCGQAPSPAPSSEPTPSSPSTPKTPTPDDRAKKLNVPCVTSQTNRSDSVNVVAYGIRVGDGGTDQVVINADGTATVTLSQTTEAGVEAGIGNGKNVKGSVSAVDTGELKYTYNFADAQSAKDFLDQRRNALSRVADVVVPGKQTLDELSTRLGNWLQENVGDKTPWTSDADRAKHAKQRADDTADAVSIAVGAKANASAKVGAGDAKVQGEAELSAKGEAQVFLDPAKGSNFTGTLEGKLSGGVSVEFGDPKKSIGALFGLSGQVGAKGAYKVAFDSHGNPTQLVVTREITGQAVGDATVKAGDLTVPGGKGSVGAVTSTTWTLDLTVPANRVAFDKTFTVGSVSAGDYTGAVALPNLVMSSDQIKAWSELGARMDADSYEANYTYLLGSDSVAPSDKDYEAKEGVFGAGVNLTETSRTLIDATGYDHRTGGPTTKLSTCQ